MKQTKRFRKVLRRLEGVTVWVHDFKGDAAESGLSRQYLQDALVIRLLDWGVKALGIGNVPEPPGNPWLSLFITLEHVNVDYFYSVTLRLDEVVKTERNPAVKTIGSTWETFITGVAGKELLVKTTVKAMEELADYFIYDYLTENRR